MSGMGKLGSSFFSVAYTLGHEIDNSSGFRERNGQVPAYSHDLFRASGDTDAVSYTHLTLPTNREV